MALEALETVTPRKLGYLPRHGVAARSGRSAQNFAPSVLSYPLPSNSFWPFAFIPSGKEDRFVD